MENFKSLKTNELSRLAAAVAGSVHLGALCILLRAEMRTLLHCSLFVCSCIFPSSVWLYLQAYATVQIHGVGYLS